MHTYTTQSPLHYVDCFLSVQHNLIDRERGKAERELAFSHAVYVFVGFFATPFFYFVHYVYFIKPLS